VERRRSKSIVQEKSFQFAARLVRFARELRRDHVDLILIRQLLRSGTSVGANVEEALGGHSRRDFIAKLAIAAKEARETGYWLRLLDETRHHSQQELADLQTDCAGLVKMLNSIILTTRRRLAPCPDSRSTPLNSEPRTQNPELNTSNSEPRTQNSELSSI
jgi:four helix bundle protein